MRGDVLIIGDHHREAARQCFDILEEKLSASRQKSVITVAGESGAGKSEIAFALAELLRKAGKIVLILQQDDYFIYPPKTNAAKRVEDIQHVGMHEVRLNILDNNLQGFKEGISQINKPLVIFEEDRIIEETMDVGDTDIIIAEGTYTTSLKNADYRIFIDRDLDDTRAARLKRNREKQDEYLEKILAIEHDIISGQKEMANIIITKSYEAKEA